MRSSQNKICKDFLISKSIPYNVDVRLSCFSHFKSGGLCELLVSPANESSLIDLIIFLREKLISFKIIGATSNLLFLDDSDYSLLISTTSLNDISLNDDLIYAQCGSMLPDLSRFALNQSISGFEGFEGIPGTVGGAVFMNAGAYGSVTSDLFVSAKVLKPDGSVVDCVYSDMLFKNRSSAFRINPDFGILLGVFFKVNKGCRLKIYRKMSLFHNKRHKYQEWQYPTLGSLYSGSIYRALASKSFVYRCISSLYIGLFFKWKVFGREAPDDRKWLNDFTVSFFSIDYKYQPFSDKDMNTLIYYGQPTSSILEYIDKLNLLIGSELIIENEVVNGF